MNLGLNYASAPNYLTFGKNFDFVSKILNS